MIWATSPVFEAQRPNSAELTAVNHLDVLYCGSQRLWNSVPK
jgi:hypothetical protein